MKKTRNPASSSNDPMMYGLLATDSVESALARLKGSKWVVHPDVDPAEGRADCVLSLPGAKTIAGIGGTAFAIFKGRKKLQSIQLRFPGSKPGRAEWAKKSAADRFAAVEAIARALGWEQAIDRKASYFNPTWTGGGHEITAFATTASLDDYGGALESNPSSPPPMVRISIER